MEKYRVVHLNSSITYSSSLLRLNRALNEAGIDSCLVTMSCAMTDDKVIIIHKSLLFKVLRRIDTLIINRLSQKIYPNRVINLPFSYFNVGVNLAGNRIVKNSDIIVVHWTGATFLSLHGLKKIIDLKKPVVIACHDNGHFTGGCHVLLGCERYKEECGRCPQLGSDDDKDWSNRQLIAKKKIFRSGDVVIVSPSRWTDENVAKSAVLSGMEHYIIPNVIDVDHFKKTDSRLIREKRDIGQDSTVILFGAIAATQAPHKGYKELLKALDYFTVKYRDYGKIEIFVFGAEGDTKAYNEQFTIHYMGFLGENEMIEAYNMSDVYVVPSLEDSFNNTVAEALSTETPVVAFATGGIKDIIDHCENGYLARYGNSEDLAEGIHWVLTNNDNNRLGKNGRLKVSRCFSYPVVSEQYKKLFSKLRK